jgi:hypothetical protein
MRGLTMKKLLAVAGVAGVALMMTGGTALAGEVTGKGNPTPIDGYRAGSICSFSGLNDDPTGGGTGDPFEVGKVQNWGAALNVAKIYVGNGDNGANELAHLILTEGPGTNCRGYASNKG